MYLEPQIFASYEKYSIFCFTFLSFFVAMMNEWMAFCLLTNVLRLKLTTWNSLGFSFLGRGICYEDLDWWFRVREDHLIIVYTLHRICSILHMNKNKLYLLTVMFINHQIRKLLFSPSRADSRQFNHFLLLPIERIILMKIQNIAATVYSRFKPIWYHPRSQSFPMSLIRTSRWRYNQNCCCPYWKSTFKLDFVCCCSHSALCS